jgi:hypothetical protein
VALDHVLPPAVELFLISLLRRCQQLTAGLIVCARPDVDQLLEFVKGTVSEEKGGFLEMVV